MIQDRTKDILADVLRVGELGSKLVCTPSFDAPFGLEFRTETRAMFHIIKKGSCKFFPDMTTTIPRTLNQGDILFMPRVNNCRILSSKTARSQYYKDEVSKFSKMKIDDSNVILGMICGSYELRQSMGLPFFTLLPSYIHLTSQDLSHYPELSYTTQMILREANSSNLGSDLILSKAIDILLIQMIRYWLKNHQTDATGWLMASLHTDIGDVLSLIHKQPGKKWTIESLAKETAVSRTKLFNKFTKTVGISPIQYLTNWRIELSKQLLETTNFSVIEIANSVGYESESSFGRVFKNSQNITPGKYRNSFLSKKETAPRNISL